MSKDSTGNKKIAYIILNKNLKLTGVSTVKDRQEINLMVGFRCFLGTCTSSLFIKVVSIISPVSSCVKV